MKYIFVLFPILFYNFIFSNIAICNVKENKQKNKDILTINTTANKILSNNQSSNVQFDILKTNDYKNVKLKTDINLDNYNINNNDDKHNNGNSIQNNKHQYVSSNSVCNHYGKRQNSRWLKSKKTLTPNSQFCQLKYSQRIGYFCDCK